MSVQLDVPSVVEVLTRQMTHDHMQTRIAALRWIYHLHIKTPNQVCSHHNQVNSHQPGQFTLTRPVHIKTNKQVSSDQAGLFTSF